MKLQTIYPLFLATSILQALEPNPPEAWGQNPVAPASGVYLFCDTDPVHEIHEILEELYKEDLEESRYALLFQPGLYDSELVVKVGMNTSLVGLGEAPEETHLPHIIFEEGNPGGSLCSSENVMTNNLVIPSSEMFSLRKIRTIEDVHFLSEEVPSYVSSGFMADSVIGAAVDTGTRPHFLFRNCEMGSWQGSGWNLVFVGSQGAPETTTLSPKTALTPVQSVSNLFSTPRVAEKPYITSQEGKYSLVIPQLQLEKQGSSESDVPAVSFVDFTHVYVTDPSDTASRINEKISDPDVEAILLSPGIYDLEETIVINKENFVLLGLGFPTLVATSSSPCISVQADNIRVGGIVLEAGPLDGETKTLLSWESSETAGFLYDCTARCGKQGDFSSKGVETLISIESPNVICDHLHLVRVPPFESEERDLQENRVAQALVVRGDNVTVYGLVAKETEKDLVQWFGSDGQCYFFAAKLPSDAKDSYLRPTSHVAYRLGAKSAPHQAFGFVVYSDFLHPQISIPSAIQTPIDTRIEFTNPMTCHLGGKGGIGSVINGQGLAVHSLQKGPYPLFQYMNKTSLRNFHHRRR